MPKEKKEMTCRWLAVFLLIAVTAAVYWQVRTHDFVYYDDLDYVVENSYIEGGLTLKNIRWAFTALYAANWHPVTWISHMADRQFFGESAAGPHLVNLFLHLANTVLLLLLLQFMTGGFWPSALVAALFALHPLHVESVAWVAERKDVLSTTFFLLTLLCYARYVQKPEAVRYGAALLFFALGLMTKPMLVTLPFLLILLDFWPLGRFALSSFPKVEPGPKGESLRRLLAEKVPFLFLSILSSLVTLVAQQSAMSPLTKLSLRARVGNALTSYAGYLKQMIWPVDLAVFYPLVPEQPGWKIAVAALFLVAVTVWVVRAFRRRPYLLTGWLWYLGTLVPVIGIVQVGAQSMADRYTYIPLVGVFMMISWGLVETASRWPGSRRPLAASSLLVLALLSGLTWKQAGNWQDSLTLFNSCPAVRKGYVADHAIGLSLSKIGRDEEAMAYIANSIRLNPDNARARHDLGILLARKGDLQGAVAELHEAVRMNPDNLQFRYDLGVSLADTGKLDEAAAQYAAVLKEKPDHAQALNNAGVVLARQGKMMDAIDYFSRALRIRPDDEQARRNLELAQRMVGQLR